ncbi:MAG: hypothetical protein ABII18_00265 [bacterium]|nr:hypothetical protein [bacterium]MBU1918839.1 hypothetical protein [bacterium]
MFGTSPINTVKNISLVALGSCFLDVAPGNFRPNLMPTAHAVVDSVDLGPPAKKAEQLTTKPIKNSHALELLLGLGALGVAAGIGTSLWRRSRDHSLVSQAEAASRLTPERNQPLLLPQTRQELLLWHARFRSEFLPILMRFAEQKRQTLNPDFHINLNDDSPSKHAYYFVTRKHGCVRVLYDEYNKVLQLDFAEEMNFQNPYACNFHPVFVSDTHKLKPKVFDRDFFASHLPKLSSSELSKLIEGNDPIWTIYVEAQEPIIIFSPFADFPYDDDGGFGEE